LKRIRGVHLVTLRKNLSVSLTGESCYLNCRHCGGKYLKNMSKLDEIPDEPGRYTSLLISGGVNERGEVPIELFKDDLRRLKERGYRLNLHTGIIREKRDLEFLKYADSVSVELVSSNEIIKDVFNADFTVDDYIRTYRTLENLNVNLHPHITLGLDCGRMRHDFKIIDLLEELNPPKLVVNLFIPTLGTEFENCEPPDLEKVEQFFELLNIRLKNTILFLGCMQPKGRYREKLQMVALRSGVRVVVKPVEGLIRMLRENEIEYKEFDECCSFVEVDEVEDGTY